MKVIQSEPESENKESHSRKRCFRTAIKEQRGKYGISNICGTLNTNTGTHTWKSFRNYRMPSVASIQYFVEWIFCRSLRPLNSYVIGNFLFRFRLRLNSICFLACTKIINTPCLGYLALNETASICQWNRATETIFCGFINHPRLDYSDHTQIDRYVAIRVNRNENGSHLLVIWLVRGLVILSVRFTSQPINIFSKRWKCIRFQAHIGINTTRHIANDYPSAHSIVYGHDCECNESKHLLTWPHSLAGPVDQNDLLHFNSVQFRMLKTVWYWLHSRPSIR